MVLPAANPTLDAAVIDGLPTASPRRTRDGLRRRGATALEYLAVLSLIVIVAMIGIGYFGQSTKDNLKGTGDTIGKATNRGATPP